MGFLSSSQKELHTTPTKKNSLEENKSATRTYPIFKLHDRPKQTMKRTSTQQGHMENEFGLRRPVVQKINVSAKRCYLCHI